MDGTLFEPFLVDRTLECLVSLVEGDAGVSSLFVPFCDYASILEFLEGILGDLPVNRQTLTVRNIIASILRRYGSSDMDLDSELAARDLSASTDQAVKFLLPFLNGQREVQKSDETTCHHIAFYLLIFIETYPGIRKVMKDNVSKLMNKLGDSTLFSILGSDFLFLYDENPPTALVKTADLDFSDLPMLFRAQPIYKFPEFGRAIQDRACQFYQFPTEIPRVENGWRMSLANSVVSSSTSFVDIMSQMVLEHLSTGEFERISEVTLGFEDLVPFLLCGHQNLIYADLHGCMALLEQEYPKSIASECLQMFRNDANLVGMMTCVTSNEVCVADLQYVSIPKLLEFALNNSEILKFASLKYFSYGEKDTEIDFDFIKSFQILESFMNLLVSGPQKLKQVLGEMSKLLASIVDKETLKKVVTDVFSLLFLKKDDKFVATSLIARQTLSVLDKFNVCPQVKQGLKFITDKVEYSAQFRRDPTEIFKAIDAKNWALADRLTNAVPKYRNLYLMALSVYTALEQRKIPKEGEESMNMINLEVLFSFFSGKELTTIHKEVQKDVQAPQKEGYGRFFTQFKDFIMKTGETVVMPEECEYVSFVGKAYSEMGDAVVELCKTLKLDQDKFKALCAVREKVRDDSMFQILPNYVKWQPLNEMVDMFESDFIEFISSGQQQLMDFSMAVSLKDFLTYVEQYYKAAMLCTRGNEKGVFEGFDMRRAIAGVFNIGNLERAEEWCSKAKTTLFDYVLSNLDWFNISQQFIDKYQDEHPIEIMCLCDTVPDLTTTKTGLVFDVHKETLPDEWDEESEISRLISNAKEGIDVDIDDILFRVDPKELYTRLMEMAGTQSSLPDSLYTLLKLVDYVGDESDSQKLRMIELTHELGTQSNEQIIDKFINTQQFERLYDFIDHNQEYLSHVLERYLSLELNLESLLYRFPALIPNVLQRFEFDPTKVDLLLKFSPESRRKYLYSVKYLPKVVQESCNVLKLDDVKAFLIANPSVLEYVDKSVHDILTDDVVIDILNSFSNSFMLYTKVHQAVSRNLVEDPARFFDLWYEQAMKFIESIDVNSFESERDALHGLELILSILHGTESYTEQREQIAFLRDFVALSPYSLVRLCYTFESFRNREAMGKSMMKFLFEFDAETGMVERCTKIFGVSMENFYLNQCAHMIRLGFVKEAKTYFMDLKKKFKSIYIEDLCLYSDPVETKELDMRIPFLSLLDKHSVFDRDQIGSVSITEQTLESYQGLTYIRNVISSQKKSPGNEPEIRYYTAHAVRRGTTISMLMFNGSYDLAYSQMLSMTDDPKQRIEAFIHSFFYPAMCTDNIAKWRRCLVLQDPELRITEQLVSRLLAFMASHHLYHGMFEISDMANRYDEGVEAAISLFHISTKLEDRLFYLAQADLCLEHATHARESNEQVKPRYIRSSQTDEELQSKKPLVKLQMAILQILERRKVPFDDSFDMLFEKSAFAKAGAYFVLADDQHNKETLLETGQVKMIEIVNQLATVLSDLEREDIKGFIERCRRKDPELLNLVIPKLLPALAMKFRSEALLSIIPISSTNPQVQGGLFYEFDCLYEALASAADDPSIIPLVAHRASELGFDTVVDQCLMLLRL